MNALNDFALRFQTLLVHGLGTSLVRGRIGLVAASEIRGGGEPRSRPGWYLWLTARSGVYRIDVDDAARLADDAGDVLHGRASLRYYPSPFDPDLAAFSPEEQAIAGGGWLDATGAPRAAAEGSIPQQCFVVGALDCAFDQHGALLAVKIAAIDRLRATFAEPWEGESFPLGIVKRGRGERTRDVPAWRIARPVFSAIAALGAQLGRRSASRLVVSRRRGFETVHVGGAPERRASDGAVQGEAVLLLGDDVRRATSDAVLAAMVDPEGETILDVDGRSGATHCADSRLALDVDPTWFSDETLPQDLLACSG